MANSLVLGITYPHGNTPTVTDNNGNSWPGSPAKSVDDGVGNYVTSIFVLPSVRSGQTTLTVAFGANVIPFNYTLTEISNLDPTTPANGTAGTAGVAAPSLATGSFTPGNNDAGGGNLIWNYNALAVAATPNPTNMASGTNFTLLDADIAWINGQGFPHASQYWLQATSAAVNPAMTLTGDSANHYNCVAVALKVSGGTPAIIQHTASSADPVAISSGNAGDNFKIPIPNPCGSTTIPAGLYINKIIHFTGPGNAGAFSNTTWDLQFPCVGNLRFFIMPVEGDSNRFNISGVTDSEGGTWTKIFPGTMQPQAWYRANTSPNPNLVVHFQVVSNNSLSPSIRAYDISGAATLPIDASAGAPNTGCNSQTSVTGFPVISVPTAGDLVIAVAPLEFGPGLAVAGPAGAVFDICTFSNEIDANLIENADLTAHLYNSPSGSQSWNWTISSQNPNNIDALAVAIKAAPLTGTTLAGRTTLVMM